MAKMSKLLLALLLVVVMVFATACVPEGEVKPPVGDDTSSSAGDTTDETGDDTDDQKDEGAAEEVTLEETVLYEADGVKVTATGLEEGFFGTEVKFLLENNSDKNVLITSDSVSVNGFMMSGASLYTEVSAGKKANDTMSFMSSELEQAGIETMAQIQFYLKIQDPDSWDTINTSELLTLGTSAADYVQPVDDSGEVVYNEKGFKIVCKGLKQDLIWDSTVVFYMENNSDQEVSIYAENVSVNGFMQDVSLWSDLRPDTKIIDGMSMLDLEDLEIESIDQIQNIEFSLRIVDANTWKEIVTTDPITVNFE